MGNKKRHSNANDRRILLLSDMLKQMQAGSKTLTEKEVASAVLRHVIKEVQHGKQG